MVTDSDSGNYSRNARLLALLIMFFLWKCTVRVQGLPDMDGISPINMEGMTRMVSEFSRFKNLFDAEDRW